MEIVRTLASVQKVLSVEPIPKADRIELVTVLGWECVVKKGEFKKGDLCVYFEIDSVLPEHPVFEFMEDRKYRVKTAKFRKQIAQGLALPINPMMESFMSPHDISFLTEGMNLTEVIGVTKYDPPEKGENQESQRVKRNVVVRYMMKFAWFRSTYFFFIPKRTKGNFPEFIPKTDEPRLQSKPSILWNNLGKEFYLTEKLDGTSATFFFNHDLAKKNRFGLHIDKGKGFGVCSRNLRLPTPDGSYWWEIVKTFGIDKTLTDFCMATNRSLAIQGEIIGSSIQKNKYKLANKRVYRVYNIWDIDKQEYLRIEDRLAMCDALDLVTVPYLGTFIVEDDTTVKDLVEFSTRVSRYHKQTIAEGIVCRQMEDENISFKVINPKFLLKNDE